MKFTKRQMLLIPEANPMSFVFFFERGNGGTSWSIRGYSIADPGSGIRTWFDLAGRGVANQESVAVTVDGRGTRP